MRLLLLLSILLLWLGCSRTLVEKPAEVGLIARDYPASTDVQLPGVAIPSTSGAIVPGTDPTYFILRSPDLLLGELAAVEFRRLLMASGKYRVYTQENPKADLVVKVSCSELVPDISQRKDGSKVPLREAGTLLIVAGALSSHSVSYLPGVGALIHAFEPLTGLALSKKTSSRVGSLAIEVQIQNRQGRVLDSRTFASSFSATAAERGRITSSSRYKAVAASFAQDAVLAAVKDAVAHFERVSGS